MKTLDFNQAINLVLTPSVRLKKAYMVLYGASFLLLLWASIALNPVVMACCWLLFFIAMVVSFRHYALLSKVEGFYLSEGQASVLIDGEKYLVEEISSPFTSYFLIVLPLRLNPLASNKYRHLSLILLGDSADSESLRKVRVILSS